MGFSDIGISDRLIVGKRMRVESVVFYATVALYRVRIWLGIAIVYMPPNCPATQTIRGLRIE